MHITTVIISALLPLVMAGRDFGRGNENKPPIPPPPATACNEQAVQSCQAEHQSAKDSLLRQNFQLQEILKIAGTNQESLQRDLQRLYEQKTAIQKDLILLSNEIDFFSSQNETPPPSEKLSQNKTAALSAWLSEPDDWKILVIAWLHIPQEALAWNFSGTAAYLTQLVREQFTLQAQADSLEGTVNTVNAELFRVTESCIHAQESETRITNASQEEQQFIDTTCRKNICGQ